MSIYDIHTGLYYVFWNNFNTYCRRKNGFGEKWEAAANRELINYGGIYDIGRQSIYFKHEEDKIAFILEFS